jgi:hypothetical protein
MINVVNAKRGCGYRKKGGLYLFSSSGFVSCHKLPIPLTVCPCCSAGIKFSRGWTWISDMLLQSKACPKKQCLKKQCVPFDGSVEKLGLIWIGKEFYKKTSDFTKEANEMGISRRIKSIPRGFKVGETWVALAHIHAITDFDNKKQSAGIFAVFKPERIEYIIKGDETPEFLQGLEERGITLAQLVPDKEQFQEKLNL